MKVPFVIIPTLAFKFNNSIFRLPHSTKIFTQIFTDFRCLFWVESLNDFQIFCLFSFYSTQFFTPLRPKRISLSISVAFFILSHFDGFRFIEVVLLRMEEHKTFVFPIRKINEKSPEVKLHVWGSIKIFCEQAASAAHMDGIFNIKKKRKREKKEKIHGRNVISFFTTLYRKEKILC